jgi:PAS domain S-box-containing protein
VIIRNFETDRITFWNTGAERLYGWSASQAIGRQWGELIFAEAGHGDVLIKRLISTRMMGRKRLPFSRDSGLRL